MLHFLITIKKGSSYINLLKSQSSLLLCAYGGFMRCLVFPQFFLKAIKEKTFPQTFQNKKPCQFFFWQMCDKFLCFFYFYKETNMNKRKKYEMKMQKKKNE